MKALMLDGKRFGRLLVISYAGNIKTRRHWNCMCDCGNDCVVSACLLAAGITKSCGCLQKERAAQCKSKHSQAIHSARSGAYSSWSAMKSRCSNPNVPAYKYYGGKGIKVCERWMDFQNFYEDMGDRPPNKSIDRIDSNKDYCKDNCRWATKAEQARNNGTSKLTMEKAESIRNDLRSIGEIANDYGVGRETIKRVKRNETWHDAGQAGI